MSNTYVIREGLDFEGPAFEIKEAGRLLRIILSSVGIAGVLGTEGIKGASPLASIKNNTSLYVPYISEVYAIITAI